MNDEAMEFEEFVKALSLRDFKDCKRKYKGYKRSTKRITLPEIKPILRKNQIIKWIGEADSGDVIIISVNGETHRMHEARELKMLSPNDVIVLKELPLLNHEDIATGEEFLVILKHLVDLVLGNLVPYEWVACNPYLKENETVPTYEEYVAYLDALSKGDIFKPLEVDQCI